MLELVEEVQAEPVERLLRLDVERGELAGEEQDPHRDQDRTGELTQLNLEAQEALDRLGLNFFDDV